MMKSHTIPLESTDKVNHLFVQHALPVSHSVAVIGYVEISQCCVQVTLYFAQQWPQSPRIMMLAIQTC